MKKPFIWFTLYMMSVAIGWFLYHTREAEAKDQIPSAQVLARSVFYDTSRREFTVTVIRDPRGPSYRDLVIVTGTNCTIAVAPSDNGNLTVKE